MAKDKKRFQGGSAGSSGAVYGFGLIGALVYFVQNSNGFWPFLLAILKAIVWPALLIYKLLQFLGM